MAELSDRSTLGALADESRRKHPMQIGTVLRSTHSGDIAARKRQYRTVTDVHPGWVLLATRIGSGRVNETKVKRAHSGKVAGHEVVSHPEADDA